MSRRPEVVRVLVVTGGRALCVAVVASATLALVGSPEGLTPSWAWLVATLVVAVTVFVTRVPLERLADRAAYGRDGDPHAVLARFVDRVSQTMAVDDVLPQVARTVTQALHSEHGEVRLWLADGEQWRQTWPLDVSAPQGELVDVPLRHHGEQVGQLGLSIRSDDLSPDDRDLLSRLAGTAGLALANVRLTYDLRRQLAESTRLAQRLESSRQRLLDAAAEQTRRFSATVASQVQSRLDRVDEALARMEEGNVDAVDEAKVEASAALQSLRELAAGVFPPALADRGLRHALEVFGLRYPGRITLRADSLSPMPLAAEAAAYFCVVAIVEDCVGDGPLEVQVTQTSAVLGVSVRPARPPSAGTVQLLNDRVDATGGTLSTSTTPAGPLLISWPLARQADPPECSATPT